MEDESYHKTWKELLPPVVTQKNRESLFWHQEKAGEKEDSPLLNYLVNFLKLIVAFVGTALGVYIFLAAPAYWAKADYAISHWGQQASPVTIAYENKNEQVIKLADVKNPSPLPTASPAASGEQKQATGLGLQDLENNLLIIPKIGIKVPVVWNSSPDEKIMLKNLQQGVVHYNGTALPGQGKGPIFISGHSSYYWWDKGAYKTVFANLDKLEKGDEIALAYNDIVYIYKVFDKIMVKPEQTEVLAPVDEPILDLMTCVPVGTNLKRLIIKTREISPAKSLEEIKKETAPSTPSPQPSPTVLGPSDTIEILPWR